MDVNWAAALAALRVDNSVELKAVLSAALKAALKADQKAASRAAPWGLLASK